MDFVQNLYCALVFIVLSIITYYDLKERRIPNGLLVFLLLMKTGYLVLSFLLQKSIFVKEFLYSIFGILFFAVISLAAYAFLSRTTGAGDFKLLISLGFVLGFFDAATLSVICLMITMLVFLIHLFIKKKKWKKLTMAPVVLLAFSFLYLFKNLL